jgi:hypothetical protein
MGSWGTENTPGAYSLYGLNKMPTLGNVNNFANVVVSLDPRKTPYVGIGMTEPGQFKVWLSPQQWCISLPENLTDQEAHEVQLLLNQGVLVPGKVYIPVLVKNQAVLESYLEIGRRSRTLDAKTKLPFQEQEVLAFCHHVSHLQSVH